MSARAHFVSTTPRPERCGCGRLLLVGFAEGFSYRVEADPINHRGEVSAVIDGYDTYESYESTIPRVHADNTEVLRSSAVTMAYRDSHRMTACADSTPVFVKHSCRRRIPNAHRNGQLPPAVHSLIHQARAETNEPPF